ncbi:MAG TPA: spore coat U domain-containing protein [Burkholderiaceae bacterium]
MRPLMPLAASLRTLAALAAVLSALLGAAPAQALCVGVCSCGVTTANIVFGNINPLNPSNADATGSVTVSCSGVAGLLIPVTVDLSKGGGASFASRSMSGGSGRLQYNLYADSAHTQVFGDGTASTVDGNASILLNALGQGPAANFNVYGRVFGSQTAAVPGAYSDTLAVTLTYY